MTPVIYATNGWGIHDERWITALRSLHFDPHIVSLSKGAGSPSELREHVAHLQAKHPQAPIFAGPLDSVTIHLAGLPHLVGLSWGFDLQSPNSAVLDFLPTLQGLVVDTEMNRKLALHHGLDETRITVLPWGVDLDRFFPDGPEADRNSLNIPADAPIMLSLRAHEHIYRIQEIIEAFALIHETDPAPILVIGNHGSLTERLRQRVAELALDDHVFFIGQRHEDELPALLRGASVYVSASEVDGTSVTMLQAMACGTPCIVTDLPQNEAWVEDGVSGFTFTSGNTKQLAHAMTRALNETPESMTDAALQRVQHGADWAANLPKLAEVLENA